MFDYNLYVFVYICVCLCQSMCDKIQRTHIWNYNQVWCVHRQVTWSKLIFHEHTLK